MAGVCFYNFTVGYLLRHQDIMSDGPNRLKGRMGSPWNSFLSYKNER